MNPLELANAERCRRLAEALHANGHRHAWSFLQAHPGVALDELAGTLGNGLFAYNLQHAAFDHCLSTREVGPLLRDLSARKARANLPHGWIAETYGDSATADFIFYEPYESLMLAFSGSINAIQPSIGWLPESGDDELLVSAYDRAISTRTDEQRALIDQGLVLPLHGEAYKVLLAPYFEQTGISSRGADHKADYNSGDGLLGQLAAMPTIVANLLAAHWLAQAVYNGGFDRLKSSSPSELVTRALIGFRAVGMIECPALVEQAIQNDGSKYSMKELGHRFFELRCYEAGGFNACADRYSGIVLPPRNTLS